MKELITILLGCVLANNYALSAGLGLTPMLGFARRGEKTLALGLAVTAVTVLSALILWPLRGLLPAALQVLAAVTLTLILVYLLQLLCGKKLGVWFPIIALNSAVLGLSLNVLALDSFLAALFTALGVGLGFLLGLFLLSGVQTRIEEDQVPKAFRGFPIQILAAAIVAMALTGF